VQVTFRNGRGYWFRDEAQVERVRSLVIWAERTRAVTLARYFGRRSNFRRTYPVSVKVQSFERTEELEAAFAKLAATSDAPRGHDIPDVVVGPHDWIGRIAREESVIEPPISAQRLRQISPVALDALSRDGRLYGIPSTSPSGGKVSWTRSSNSLNLVGTARYVPCLTAPRRPPCSWKGRAPFFVCSSRALSAIRARHLDVTVSPVPRWASGPRGLWFRAYGLFIYRGRRACLRHVISYPATCRSHAPVWT
jgi:hypothetical protein